MGNNSVSYFLTYPSYPSGLDILSGDRNLMVDAYGATCSVFGPSAAAVIRGVNSGVAWTGSIHFQSGNLLYRDGSVEQAGQAGLHERFKYPIDIDGNGEVHMLLP